MQPGKLVVDYIGGVMGLHISFFSLKGYAMHFPELFWNYIFYLILIKYIYIYWIKLTLNETFSFFLQKSPLLRSCVFNCKIILIKMSYSLQYSCHDNYFCCHSNLRNLIPFWILQILSLPSSPLPHVNPKLSLLSLMSPTVTFTLLTNLLVIPQPKPTYNATRTSKPGWKKL